MEEVQQTLAKANALFVDEDFNAALPLCVIGLCDVTAPSPVPRLSRPRFGC